MSRRRSKETVEFVIRPESTVPEETVRAKKKKKKKKEDNNKKLGEKGVLPKENKRRGSTLHTIVEEEELEEDLNGNVCSSTKNSRGKRFGCSFFGRKKKLAKQEVNDKKWHAGWAFIIRSACQNEKGENGQKVIVSTEYDTVDCTTSVSRAEDDELLHAYRKRPRRNAVCEAGIGDEERTGLKRVLTHYCHMLYVDKYGIG